MGGPGQKMVKNRLLRALSAADYAQLQPLLNRVPLDRGTVLVEPGEPITRAIFLESGIGSVVGITPGGETAEVGLCGFDGMFGLPVVQGADRSPHRFLMQIGGEGWQLPADALRRAMDTSATLSTLLARYGQYFLVQVTQTAVSNAVHTVGERLARWLLMAHDRMDDGDVSLTHDYLAFMLAVRRPTVTTALHILEGRGLIRATRGNVRICNREGLEALASAAYGLPEAEYARLVGPMG